MFMCISWKICNGKVLAKENDTQIFFVFFKEVLKAKV